MTGEKDVELIEVGLAPAVFRNVPSPSVRPSIADGAGQCAAAPTNEGPWSKGHSIGGKCDAIGTIAIAASINKRVGTIFPHLQSTTDDSARLLREIDPDKGLRSHPGPLTVLRACDLSRLTPNLHPWVQGWD